MMWMAFWQRWQGGPVQRLICNKPGAVESSPDPRRFTADAIQALLAEVNLTPKPGLVDRRNTGAHRDMHVGTFYKSAAAIGEWLPRFIHQGRVDAALPWQRILSRLRPAGMACENQMYQATGGVNTHKGSIFSLSLLCAAFGRLYQQRQIISATTLCSGVAAICQGLVSRELANNNPRQTAGQRLYATHGLRGARGEAEAGFPLVINGALPLLLQGRAKGRSEQEVMTDCLLWLMAHNDDTNVVSRGGMAGLQWLQQESAALLAQREREDRQAKWQALIRFDDACIARNLSPGGSADLLIVSWLLAQLPQS